MNERVSHYQDSLLGAYKNVFTFSGGGGGHRHNDLQNKFTYD